MELDPRSSAAHLIVDDCRSFCRISFSWSNVHLVDETTMYLDCLHFMLCLEWHHDGNNKSSWHLFRKTAHRYRQRILHGEPLRRLTSQTSKILTLLDLRTNLHSGSHSRTISRSFNRSLQRIYQRWLAGRHSCRQLHGQNSWTKLLHDPTRLGLHCACDHLHWAILHSRVASVRGSFLSKAQL